MRTFAKARALVAGLVVAAAAVPAAAQNFEFGTLLSGSFTPSGSFAHLSVRQVGPNVFDFSLHAGNLNALFTQGSFVGAVAVNVDPSVKASAVTISNFSGYGVEAVTAKNGGGPGGVWEFRFAVGGGGASQEGAYRLSSGEFASWTASFSSALPVTFGGGGQPAFAAHVQGLTPAQGGSAWYAPSMTTAAPEPEVYAMMLAGLLLVGFAARRRQSRLHPPELMLRS